MEIVGDGYLVASGLPKPNGDKHASEISRMALQLMSQVDSFKVFIACEAKLPISWYKKSFLI